MFCSFPFHFLIMHMEQLSMTVCSGQTNSEQRCSHFNAKQKLPTFILFIPFKVLCLYEKINKTNIHWGIPFQKDLFLDLLPKTWESETFSILFIKNSLTKRRFTLRKWKLPLVLGSDHKSRLYKPLYIDWRLFISVKNQILLKITRILKKISYFFYIFSSIFPATKGGKKVFFYAG